MTSGSRGGQVFGTSLVGASNRMWLSAITVANVVWMCTISNQILLVLVETLNHHEVAFHRVSGCEDQGTAIRRKTRLRTPVGQASRNIRNVLDFSGAQVQ